MNKKLLWITKNYPPDPDSRAQRVFYFSYYLSKMGWTIDILTEKKGKDFPNEFDMGSLKIFEYSRCLETKYESSQKKNQKRKGEIVDNIKVAEFLDKYSLIDKNIDQIFSLILKALRLLRKENYDAIIASGKPGSTIFGGYIVSQITRLPLVIEFGDPWTLAVNYNKPKLYRSIESRIEKSYLNKAKKVILTTYQQKELYQRFIDKNEKCDAILSGYEPSLYRNNIYLDHKFTISHIGKIYGIRTSLDKSLRALSELLFNNAMDKDHLKVSLYGKISKQIEIPVNIRDKLFYGGRISFLDSLKEMQTSTILLLLGNRGGLQIPAKVYWYVGAKRPILTILGDEKDPLKPIMSKLNRGPVVNDNKDEIKAALEHLYSLWNSGKFEEEYILSDVPDFYWTNRVKKLDSRLRVVLEKSEMDI